MNNATLELEEENNNPSSEHNDRTFAHNLNEEEMLRIYIGPNADKFLKLYHAKKDKKSILSMNWCLFFLPLVWFFYRKRYIAGCLIYSIPFSTIFLYPNIDTPYYVAYYSAIASIANSLYLDTAQKHIKDISVEGISSYEMRERLREAGGTTKLGALAGFLLYLSFIVSFVIYASQL